MSSDILKIILLIAMTIFSIMFGCLPIKLYSKFNELSSHKGAFRQKGQLIISVITCFSGGVFLGVCLLDVLPDALDSWDSVQKSLSYSSDYPFVPLFCGIGLMAVWMFEEFTILCHNYANRRLDCKSETSSSDGDIEGDILRQRKATIISRISSVADIVEQKGSITKSLTFVSAFIFHCALEGFAFGIQKDTVSISSLFVGIMLHKCVVFFSIGIRLVRAHEGRVILVFSLITLVAITAPLGGAIGIIVQDSKVDNAAKDISMLILSCLSLGTFLYIAFFELLGPEKENKRANFLQWLGAVTGFALIAITMIFDK
ncbi:unnamed protein product, partial [Mesorhabditis belari]|uniref:Uncharacterized protein n=1 Tax=Mesorhabditis belari TaxID=2138241 RepID=A0AAF3F2X2_9BILA